MTHQSRKLFRSLFALPLCTSSLVIIIFFVHCQPLMQEMCYQLDQVRLMLEKMAVRVALLEVQVKKLEGSSTMQWAESKCNGEEQCLLSYRIIYFYTLFPKLVSMPSVTKNDSVDSSGTSHSHLSQFHSPSSTETHMNTSQPPLLVNPSPPLVASTPVSTLTSQQVASPITHTNFYPQDSTRSVIDNLRSRARKARELLNKANGTLVD